MRNSMVRILCAIALSTCAIGCGETDGEPSDGVTGENGEPCVGKCDSANAVEEQRKYVFEDFDNKVEQLLTEGGVVDGITIKQHSTYTYMDIYLDTREFDLYHNNFSFRIRRRVYGDGSVNWGVQLKSEMSEPGAARMEVEIDHDDVIDYKIEYKDEKIKLTKLLDDIFDSVSKKLEDPDHKLKLGRELDALDEWLEDKVKDSNKAPFAKLRELDDDLKFESSLKSLGPIMASRSIRVRSHCYVDLDNTTDELASLTPSEMNADKVPAELQRDNLVWTMEASYDNATFLPLDKGTCNDRADIKEFEVENKYRPLEKGSFILDIFENALFFDYGADVNLDSKYRQSAEAIYMGTLDR